MGLVGKSRELQFGTCKLWQSHRQVQKRKEGPWLYGQDVGRGCPGPKFPGEAGLQGKGGSSLAELLG